MYIQKEITINALIYISDTNKLCCSTVCPYRELGGFCKLFKEKLEFKSTELGRSSLCVNTFGMGEE